MASVAFTRALRRLKVGPDGQRRNTEEGLKSHATVGSCPLPDTDQPKVFLDLEFNSELNPVVDAPALSGGRAGRAVEGSLTA